MFHSLPCTKQCCAANEVTFPSPQRQPETLTWYSVTPDRKYWSAVTADGSPESWSNSSPFTRRSSATYQPSSLRSHRPSTTSIVSRHLTLNDHREFDRSVDALLWAAEVCKVCLAPMIGHRKTQLSSPKSAVSGVIHCNKLPCYNLAGRASNRLGSAVRVANMGPTAIMPIEAAAFLDRADT
jgi:hypothetical protein